MSNHLYRTTMHRCARFILTALSVASLLTGISIVLSSSAYAVGGAYKITWTAADPKYGNGPFTPTYPKLTPGQLIPPNSNPAPSGGTGRASDPLANAVYGNPADSVSSLAPADMALGQIVPFEAKIAVSGDITPENGTIEFTPFFRTKTTSGDNFGYDPAYGIYTAFVDTADAAMVNGTTAKVASYSWTIVNPATSTERIQGPIRVSGLKSGDTVIVEVWVVLKSTIPAGSSGVVQSGIDSAQTVTTTPDTINTGTQTIPLQKVEDFLTASADVSVSKTDSPDPVNAGQQITYSILVTNNSTTTAASGIVVTDTLSPNVSFVSASGAPYTISGNTVTFNVGNLSPNTPGPPNTVTLQIVVVALSTAPNNDTSTNAEAGSNTAPNASLVDVINKVTVSATTGDSTSSNNTYYQPTNVVPAPANTASMSISKVAVLNTAVVSPSDRADVGDQINYTITVTNTGNVTLTGVTVSDTLLTSLSATWPGPVGTLTPGQSATFTGTYTLTQADINAGKVDNTATAKSNQTPDATANSSVPLIQSPGLQLVKSGKLHIKGCDCIARPGDKITYTFTVTNIGNVTLTNVTLSDPKITITGGPITTLAPGATNSTTFTGTYTLTLADFLAGQVDNTATVSGTPPSGPAVSAIANETVTVPCLHIIACKFKDCDRDGCWDKGEPALAGWTIELYDCNGRLIDNKQTDANGKADFCVPPGKYKVKEVLQPGWINTRAQQCSVTVTCKQPYQVCFGNVQVPLQKIVVYKFKDCDRDGQWDCNEPAVADWCIELYDCTGTLVETQQTDKNGKVVFSVLPGKYTVKEEMRLGWINIRPRQCAVTVITGKNPSAIYFANMQFLRQKITVFLFKDCNRNGKCDRNEPAIANWNVLLFDCDGTLVDTVRTDGNGKVVFTVLPGTYKVKEVLQSGWVNTSSQQCSATVVTGKDCGPINFGNITR